MKLDGKAALITAIDLGSQTCVQDTALIGDL